MNVANVETDTVYSINVDIIGVVARPAGLKLTMADRKVVMMTLSPIEKATVSTTCRDRPADRSC